MTRFDSLGSPMRTRLLVAISLVALLMWATGVHAQGNKAAAPKPGGSVSVRLDAAPECLDPAKQSLAVDSQSNYPVMDGLLSLNTKGKPVPYLAQSYKVSQGGKLITFTLRHDLKFSDGKPLTAADVKYTFDRILDPATKSPIAKNFLGTVTSVKTSGKYTIKLVLSAPNRVLLSNLTSNYLGIEEHASVTAAGNNTCNGLVGSGPFKYSNVAPGYASMTETRNKNHTFGPSWAKNKGPAYLATLNFDPIVSDTTAVSELLSGQIGITDVPGTELSRVQGNKKFTLKKIVSQAETMIEFNSGKAPFNNPAVRKAVAEAVDRAAIINVALQGLGKPSYSPIASSIFGYDSKASTYVPKLDIAAAKSAISAANATGPYNFVYANAPSSTAAAELIQGELGQIGMTVNLVSDTTADWLAALQKGDFDLTLLGYTYNDPDVSYLLFNSSQKAGGLNFTNTTDGAIDKATLAGRQTLNLKKAKADYVKAQQLLVQEAIVVPLWVPITTFAFNKNIQGVQLTKSGQVQYQDLYVKK